MNKFATAIITSVLIAACAGPGGGRPDRQERPEPSPERRAEMRDRFLTQWDKNSDDQLTCEDIALERKALFITLDEDGSETLTSGEFRYAKFEDKSFLFHLFSEVDTDRSGDISVAEMQAVTHSQFEGMDKDGDCLVNDQEIMLAMRDLIRSERAERQGAERGEGRGGRGGRGGQGRRPGGLTDATTN